MYDAFKLVKAYTGQDFANAVKFLEDNRVAILSEHITPLFKEEVDYDFVTMLFGSYFSKFGITDNTLYKYDVFQARTVYRNGELSMKHSNASPIFIYHIDGRYKIYRPYAPKDKKWRGTTVYTDVWGLKQLPKKGKLLIISKSLKDVMVLHEMGFPAICFNSEGVNSPDYIKFIKTLLTRLKRRFKRIVVSFDNDEVGIKEMTSFSLIHGVPALLPKSKDWADNIIKYKHTSTFSLLKKRLSKALR